MAAQYAKDQPAGFKNRIEKVAVVGASGTMGSVITKALLKTGKHTVTALTRVGSKSVMLQGVKVAHINYAKPETIVEALRGQDFLVITLSIRSPPDTSIKLFKAAQTAGLRYVMPNCCGTSPFSGNMYEYMGLGMVRQHIIDMVAYDLKPVVLSCGFWYQFSLACGPTCYGFDIAQRKDILFDEGTVKTHMSTWPQCGRAVAALLCLPVLPVDATDTQPTLAAYVGTSKDTTVHISSFAVSQQDLFASLKRVTGTTDAD